MCPSRGRRPPPPVHQVAEMVTEIIAVLFSTAASFLFSSYCITLYCTLPLSLYISSLLLRVNLWLSLLYIRVISVLYLTLRPFYFKLWVSTFLCQSWDCLLKTTVIRTNKCSHQARDEARRTGSFSLQPPTLGGLKSHYTLQRKEENSF